MPVKFKPDQYHSLTPYLRVPTASEAIAFYRSIFGASELSRMTSPDGQTILHAEIQIGDSVLMLSDPMDGDVQRGSNIGLLIYVENVDEVFQNALRAGAQQVRAPESMFYGDRSGSFIDPYGIEWMVSTHEEDVSEAQMQERMMDQAERMAGAARS